MKSFWKRSSVLLLAAWALPACAWDSCDNEAEREASAALDGIERVEILARAGDLVVEGRGGASSVEVTGKACASSKSLLQEIHIKTEKSGSTLRVIADIPKTKGWNSQARMDLRIELPNDIRVDVDDSSGDFRAEGVQLGKVDDGSGDITIRSSSGDLDLDDGSGDIRISDFRGDVRFEDGSGDARLADIDGSVHVTSDGSGDLTMEKVTGTVKVDSDGSGDIFAGDVGGDFLVASAGSGDVRHRQVAGRVDTPSRD